jgi:hypothetical protein
MASGEPGVVQTLLVPEPGIMSGKFQLKMA